MTAAWMAGTAVRVVVRKKDEKRWCVRCGRVRRHHAARYYRVCPCGRELYFSARRGWVVTNTGRGKKLSKAVRLKIFLDGLARRPVA